MVMMDGIAEAMRAPRTAGKPVLGRITRGALFTPHELGRTFQILAGKGYRVQTCSVPQHLMFSRFRDGEAVRTVLVDVSDHASSGVMIFSSGDGAPKTEMMWDFVKRHDGGGFRRALRFIAKQPY